MKEKKGDFIMFINYVKILKYVVKKTPSPEREGVGI